MQPPCQTLTHEWQPGKKIEEKWFARPK